MKKFFLAINITVLLLIFTMGGQSQVVEILKRPANDRPEKLFNFCLDNLSGRDSIYLLKTLDSVRQWAVKKGDKKLLWYVDLFQTVFLSYRKAPAAEEQLLLSKIKHFESSPYQEIKGACYFFIGTLYYLRRDFEKSFHYYINANDIFESLGYQNIPLIGHYCYNFFRLYYQVGDYPSAIYFLEEQIKSYGPKNHKHLPFAYNNLGVTYLKVGQVAKAQTMFRKAINLATLLNNDVYIGISSGNYGNTLRLQGQYRQSLPYLYKDVALNRDTVRDNTAISCVYIANSYLHLDSINKAELYLDSALMLQPDLVWSSFSSHYYETKALFYKKTGNYRLALLYQDSLVRLRDSLKLGNDLALFKAIALQFKEEKAITERREKELEKSNLRFTRNVTIAFLLILLLTVTTYLYKQRKEERTLFRRKQRLNEEKLLHAEEQLQKYMEAIKEKNRMIAQIEANLDKATHESLDSEVKNQNAPLVFDGRSLLTENDWQEFKILFTSVHPDFFTSLQARYAGLSQGEQRLLALCKLQISSHEMASMLGISLQSVRTSRYRLRKKHPDIVNDEEFEGYI